MNITTKHRDRLRSVIREELYKFRIEQLKKGDQSSHEVDYRLDYLMRSLETAALDVLQVPTKKKPRRRSAQ